MAELTLNANERVTNRKSDNKKLRREGKVPGVLYGKGIDPVSIEVAEGALKPLVFTSEAHIVGLQINENASISCVLKDVQFDPITDRIVHFDLQSVSQDQKIEVEVPVVLVGNAAGIKGGGILEHGAHRLSVKCLAKDLPEHIEVNVEKLNLGEAIHVSDLQLENIEILNSEDTVLAAVVAPKAEVAPAEGAEAREPEVISKGKVDKE